MTDYTKLRELAQNAPPGEWVLDHAERTVRATRTHGETILWDDSCHEAENNLADGKFIAAANPTVVLALLDEIAALRRGQGTAPAPADPGTTPFHTTHPIPDSTGGTR